MGTGGTGEVKKLLE